MSQFSQWWESVKTYRKKFNDSWPAKLTAIWLLVVVGSSAINWPAFCDMGPNEWGDFLAGTMSPIAFMWLVFGYLQQGRELKQNTEALHLQQKALLLQHQELKELVGANNKIATHAEQQAKTSEEMHKFNVDEYKKVEADRIEERKEKIKPDLHLIFQSEEHERLAVLVANYGSDARSLSATSSHYNQPEFDGDSTRLRYEYKLKLTLRGKKTNPTTDAPLISISCRDMDNNLHHFNFNKKSKKEFQRID